jgi:hypothetical protein
MSTRCFMHYQGPGGTWENVGRMLARVPAVGEYVAPAEDAIWYRVSAVVFAAFPGADYPVEVFAVPAGRMHEVLTDAPGSVTRGAPRSERPS